VEEFILDPKKLSLNIKPNPFSKSAQFVLNIPADSRGENAGFSVYNVSGRRVKTFSLGGNSSSRITLTWDGKGDSGEILNSGIYFGVVRYGDEETQKKIIMIR